MQHWSQRERTILPSAFAQAVRDRCFSRNTGNPLVCQTVRATVDCVSQTFREYDKVDPRLDQNRVTSRILQQQFKGYKNHDPKEKHQKAIPLSVIRKLYEGQTNFELAVADLLTIGIFFCMRSCEYLKVPSHENRRTKLLKVHNFRFFSLNDELDKEKDNLESASSVCITFEEQKNGEKFESVTLHCTIDKLLCPVKASARVITRLRRTTSKQDIKNLGINSYFSEAEKVEITSHHAIVMLKKTVETIGESTLGFKSSEIGTEFHTVRWSHGNGTGKNRSIHNQTHRPMEVRRLHPLHPKTNQRILF